MVDFLPPENNAMSNLLAIIKDPKSAEKRMNELNDAQATLNGQIEKNKALADAAEKSKQEALAAVQKAEEIKKQNEATTIDLHKKLQDKMDSYDKALKEHQEVATVYLQKLDARDKEQTQKQTLQDQKESELASRETEVSKREKEAEAVHKEYLDKVSKLKAII